MIGFVNWPWSELRSCFDFLFSKLYPLLVVSGALLFASEFESRVKELVWYSEEIFNPVRSVRPVWLTHS